MPKSLLRLIWGLAFLCLCFALVSAVQLKREAVVVKTEVEFTNPTPREHMMSSEDAYGILEEYFGNTLEGVPVRHVETDLLEQLVENHSYVLSAEVYVDKLGALQIDIVEKEPVVRVFASDSSFYLDHRGKPLPLSMNYTARVPVLRGAMPTSLDDPEWARMAAFIMRLKSDPFTHALIDQLYIDENKEYEIIPVLGDSRIRFGTDQDFDRKLRYLKLFYVNSVRREGWNRCAVIDLRFEDQVVCKKNSRT